MKKILQQSFSFLFLKFSLILLQFELLNVIHYEKN